jgi:hypothetical protein
VKYDKIEFKTVYEEEALSFICWKLLLIAISVALTLLVKSLILHLLELLSDP